MKHALPCLLALLLGTAQVGAAERGANLVGNPGFEDGLTDWAGLSPGTVVDETVAHTGHASLRCDSDVLDASGGVRQVIALDPPVQHPFVVSGWAKAEHAEVAQDFDVYLDLHYADGTPLWGQIAHFEPGTHDWQHAALQFDAAKPVSSIEVFVLFRKAKGRVWFDDIDVRLAPFELRDLRLLPGLYGGVSLGATAATSLPARWSAALSGAQGEVARAAGEAGPIGLHWLGTSPGDYTLRLSATDDLLHETVDRTVPVKLDAAGAGRGYAVWTVDSMSRVLPHHLPAEVARAPEAHVALAGHEYESFQVVLRAAPGKQLRHVEVDPSDLVCAAIGATLPKERIEWQQEGYVRFDKLQSHPYLGDAVPGWWPDPLLGVDRVDVVDGFSQPLWFTVYAPAGTKPGDYQGTITLRPEGLAPADVAVTARVYGFDLPVRGHLKTAFALMDGYLEKLYGKPLYPDLRRRYGDFVLRHRLNPDDISRTDPPAIEDLLHYRDRGLNAFNVINMVEPRGNRTWVCWSPLEVYTPTFKQSLSDRLDPYVAELRRHGLADLAYLYTFDERGEDFYPVMREYFGMVKERYPEIRTLTTAKLAQDPAVMRDLNVDWNCPLTPAYRYDEAERCRAAGQQVWGYVCLGPRWPYANWLGDGPLMEARVLWWQAFEQKMDGILYWGLNIWDRAHNDQPIDPQAGPLLDWSITTGGDYDWLHGDGELLYAGKDGPIGSIRLANIRDGLEDYEYLWLLGQKAGNVDVARAACGPVAESLTSFTREPGVLLGQRERIAERLQADLAR
jgi:hypothetical protein